MLVTLGMLCIGIAVFALVINPRSFVEVPSLDLGTLGRVGGETRELVNLQKLAIGIASAIADRCSSPAASSPGVTDTKIRGALAAQL